MLNNFELSISTVRFTKVLASLALCSALTGCSLSLSVKSISDFFSVDEFQLRAVGAVSSTNQGSIDLEIINTLTSPEEMSYYEGADCLTADTWEPFAPTKTIALSAPEGVKIYSARIKTGTAISSCQNFNFNFDQTPPGALSFSKNGGASPTNNPLVTITATATDITTPIEYLVSTSATCSSGSWTSTSLTSAFTLPAPTTSFDGTKSLYYRFRDGAQNLTACTQYDIALDTIAPTVTLVPGMTSVNLADSTSVPVGGTCSENGANAVQITAISSGGGTFTLLNADCSAGSWSANLNFSSLQSGTVTVTAAQTDGATNTASDSEALTLDKIPPTISFATPAANSYISSTTASTFTITGSCSDNGSNNISIAASSTGGGTFTTTTTNCTGLTFSQSLDFSTLLDGTVTVNLTHSDSVANTGTASRTYLLDLTAPTLSGFTIENSATYLTSLTANLTLTTSGSPTEYYATETAGCASGGTWAAIATPTYAFNSTQGSRTLYVKVRDTAANESTCLNDSIILDTVAPTGTLSINSGDASTAATTVAVNMTADADVTHMQVYEGTCPASSPTFSTAYSPRAGYKLADIAATTTNSETRNVSVALRDAAGNIGCATDANGILLYNSRNFISFRNTGFRITDATASVNIPIYLRNYLGAAVTAGTNIDIVYSLTDENGEIQKGTATLAAGDADSQQMITVPIPNVTTEKILKLDLNYADSRNVPLHAITQMQISVIDSGAAAEDIGVIASTSDHTCVIKGTNALQTGLTNARGKLHCWGENGTRQVDATTSNDIYSPYAVDSANDYADVATGTNHTCALQWVSATDIRLKCWGANQFGQLGRGAIDASAPVGQFTIASPSATYWKWIAAGENHTCGIDSDNKLYCWG